MNPQVDRKVFRDLSYGLYIVTSRDKEKLNGQIVNTVIQVTSDPPRVAVIIPGSMFFVGQEYLPERKRPWKI